MTTTTRPSAARTGVRRRVLMAAALLLGAVVGATPAPAEAVPPAPAATPTEATSSVGAATTAPGPGVTPAPVATPARAPAVAPVTYHVDCSRRGAGNGVRTPFNSLTAVNRHAAFLPGDRVLLKRGTICRGRLHPRGSGAPGKPILLGAYPAKGARPTVAGGGTVHKTGAVELRNQHHWTVQDLHVTNAMTTVNPRSYRAGVLVENRSAGRLPGIVLQRLAIDSVHSDPSRGRTWGGISVHTVGTRASGFDGMRILRNRVSNVGRTGIVIENSQHFSSHDSDVRIAGNRVSAVRGDGIMMVGVEHGRIDHNVVAHAAQLLPCPRCGRMGGPTTASAGIWPSVARFIRIDHNEVYGTKRAGGDGQGIDVDMHSRDVVVEQNYSHDNEGGGLLFCGARQSTARFNVLQNNGRAAFTFACSDEARNLWIYNNTVYQKRSLVSNYVVRTYNGWGAKDLRFVNNIVYSYGKGKYQWPGRVLNRDNTFVGVHHRTSPRGAGTSWRDPRLALAGSGANGFGSVAGYGPTPRTPRGVRIPSSAALDFRNRAVNHLHPFRGALQTR